MFKRSWRNRDFPNRWFGKSLFFFCLVLVSLQLPAGEVTGKLDLTPEEQAWLENHPLVSFTGDPNWLPYEAFTEDGDYIGIVAEHLQIISEVSGLQFEMSPSETWTESTEKAKQGLVDILSETDDSDLAAYLNFTNPYVENPIVIAMRNTENYVENIDRISDRKIALIKDYGYASKIRRKYTNIEFITVDDIQDGLIAVSTGRVDALVCTLALCSYTIADLNLNNVRITGKTEFDTKLALGVQKNRPELHSILNKAIATITAEQRQVILNKWIKEKFAARTDYTLAYQIIAVAFVLLVIFSFWTISLFREIKLRKSIEVDLKASSATNERYRVLFFESPVGHALNRFEDGTFISSNQAFEKITGYTQAELQELSYWELTPESYAEDEERQLESLRTTGKYGPYEKHYIQKNGNHVAVRLNGSLVTDQDGEQIILSIVEDISAERERERAEMANAAKSDFLSSMSHELRTPLNAILGHAQILQFDKHLLNGEQLESVGEIMKGGNHLLELINDVLDLAKIESGSLKVFIEHTPLSGVIAECQSMTAVLAHDAGIRLDFGNPDQFVVRADKFRLKQILINYISNAIKYNRPDGSIELSYEPLPENKLRICVADTGVGLDEDQLAKVFSSFERLGAEYSSVEGVGIGLSLSKKLAELMGAEVGVSSVKGEGSKFWVDVNCAVKQKKPAVLVDEPAFVPSPKATAGERTILYIEDNSINLAVVQRTIQKRTPYKFISALEPYSGLDFAVTYKPDLILVDIDLPGIDGFEVLKRLRARVNPCPPVLAISASALAKDIEKGKKAGFDEYITKPVDLTLLVEKINKHLAS